MINFLGCSTQGMAVANGAITLALLELLVERKIITRADVRTVLGTGIECLEPRINVRAVAEAVHVMRDEMLPLFV
jgi:hypothetical protein